MLNTREQKAVELRDKYPNKSNAAIGQILGVSREMVRQYLKKNNRPTRVPVQSIPLCEDCGALVSKASTTFLCRECKHNRTFVEVICNTCGTIVKRSKPFYDRTMRDDKRYPNKVFYCGRDCFYSRPK